MNCIAESHACSEGIKSEVTVKALLINKMLQTSNAQSAPADFSRRQHQDFIT
jgi:hypothetical protein